jgi:pimeloyl-ACP methyl ester carboxylesterase
VLLPDGPGSGRSEPPRTADGYRIPGRVAALDALFRALALEKADLVGHSLGGWTVARFALDHPEKTGRLVLVDAGGFTVPSDVEAEKRRVLPEDRAGARRVLDLLFHRRPFPAAGFVVNAFGRNYGGDPAAATVLSLDIADGLAGREKDLPRGTAVIWGAEETLFPLPGGRALAAGIPEGRLFVLEGAGHDGPLETPRAFREALAAALLPQSGASR